MVYVKIFSSAVIIIYVQSYPQRKPAASLQTACKNIKKTHPKLRTIMGEQ